MLHNIKAIYLHCVFHGIRFKVNEDWESGKIPFFYALNFPLQNVGSFSLKRRLILVQASVHFH